MSSRVLQTNQRTKWFLEQMLILIAATTPDASRGTFLKRVVLPFPKIVINLPGTYEKLHCLG